MQHDEWISAANLAGHGMSSTDNRLGQSGAVTNHDDVGWIISLGDNSVASVIAEHNHPRRSPQGPTMKPFPESYPAGWTHDFTGNRHFWIKIADVVNKWPPLEPCDECADDTFERRVRHGENNVCPDHQCAGNCQDNV